MTTADKHEDHHDNHDHHDHHEMMIQDFKRRFWVSLVLSVPVLLLSPLIQSFFGIESIAFANQSIVAAVIATIIYFYGGKPFLTGTRDELSDKNPGMMTLIGVAISVAYIYSMVVVLGIEGEVFFWELATLIDVMLLGHWIEMRSVMGASKALDELAKLMPATAHKVVGENETEDIPVAELKRGDSVVIKPGEKMPADGVIVEGSTSVNESMITGESRPVEKTVGDEVIGGSINQDGSITVEVRKTGEESYLAQVMEMVRSAQASKSKTQNLANRAAFWLTLIAIGGGIITFSVWILLGNEVNFALSRMVTVMVITCPHALGLAIPLVVSRSTALTAQNGLLIRNRDGFEDLRGVDTIVLDKTGTLTEGNFSVSDITAFTDAITKEELLMLAASVESRSEHPLARPIVRAAEKTKDVDEFEALPGKGVSGKVDDKTVKVVGPSYLKEHDITIQESHYVEDGAVTRVHVLVDENPVGFIELADTIRPQSKNTIRELKNRGIQPIMLTGDSEAVARSVASELGIEKYYAEVLPEEKQSIVAELKEQGNRVAMVGDGVNDAPALAIADVGIAIGAGTDVAAETADIILVNSNPQDVLQAVDFSKTTYRKMKQNLWWATGYNVVAIPLAAGVLYFAGILLSPAMGAALMSVSTVVVAINARALNFN